MGGAWKDLENKHSIHLFGQTQKSINVKVQLRVQLPGDALLLFMHVAKLRINQSASCHP